MAKLTPIYEKLAEELKDLPGENSHLEMIPFRRATSEALKTATDYRISSVLALMFESNSGTELILTERQSYRGKHSGQISFPGGKMEDFDKDTVSTALRETHEEIGIHPATVNVLGKLTDVYIPVSKFLVHPYVGYLNDQPDFIQDQREVKSIITFPVHDLLKEETRIITKIQNHQGIWMKDIPGFSIQKKTVWGATALMLNELRHILKRF